MATWILEPLRSVGSDTAHGGQLDVGTAEPRAEWCAEIFSPQEGMQDGSRGREYNVWKERSLLKCVHGAVEEARDNANCRAALPRRAHARTRTPLHRSIYRIMPAIISVATLPAHAAPCHVGRSVKKKQRRDRSPSIRLPRAEEQVLHVQPKRMSSFAHDGGIRR